VLFALPTFTSRRVPGAISFTPQEASSRILDLNGEAKTARTKQNSPIIQPA
jgi:hypothetical protein